MQVSYQWLKDLVEVPDGAQDLADKLSTTGIEVEGVSLAKEGLSKLVVGEVLSCEAIPETHLSLCQVNVGETAPSQIVCGAPNVKAGIKVIVALPGARIAGNYKIKKGKIRGFESLGMICSLSEIGYSDKVIPKDYADGIQYLPDEARPGDEVFDYLGMADDMLELSITPNRADALSMHGVAHEVAAIYGVKPHFDKKSLKEAQEPISQHLALKVADERVTRYELRMIDHVVVAPSPQWLQNRLMNAGIRPINNVVDVTNYVLLTYGQPLHAFDYDTFKDQEVLVRPAKKGETITTLDGEERSLDGDIVITNQDKPIALAGVMGGADTEISDQTTRIVLEAASFDGTSIRKTSQKFNLRSEASMRFEKGINQDTIQEALDYASAMIQELAKGEVLAGRLTHEVALADEPLITISLTQVNQALGTSLSLHEVLAIFDRLGFDVAYESEVLKVTIPRRRWDIRIPADLVEEVARLYGYDNLPVSLPKGGNTIGELTPMQAYKRKIRRYLEGSGLSEVISYSLTTQDKALSFTQGVQHLTHLALSMSEVHESLRLDVLPGMLDIASFNYARGNKSLALYELGTVFPKASEATQLPEEAVRLGIVMTDTDFYGIKQVVDNCLLGIESVRYEATSAYSEMHPGRTAIISIQGEPIGFIGQLHPKTAGQYDLEATYVASLSVEALLHHQPKQAVFEDIPKFQAATRDIALLLDRAVTHQEIVDVITSSKVKILANVSLFDIYTGDKIAKDQKSMAYQLTFLDKEAQLTDDQINQAYDKIAKKLVDFGAVIR